jgi:hypothetical protein
MHINDVGRERLDIMAREHRQNIEGRQSEECLVDPCKKFLGLHPFEKFLDGLF